MTSPSISGQNGRRSRGFYCLGWLRTIAASLLLLIVALGAQGCVGFRPIYGSGRMVEKEREVSDFTSVKLATFGDLYIETGDEENLRIEAEDNLIRYFEIGVIGDRLEIRQQVGVTLRPIRPVRFYLTVKKLDTIALSGSGNIKAPDLAAERISVTISGSGDVEVEDLRADAIDVRITGSGNLDIASSEAREQTIAIYGSGDVKIGDLNADEIGIRITGSGNLDISGGEVEEQDITINGSGDYDARDLASSKAEVRITASGSTAIRARDHLRVHISGSGDVHYIGNPTIDQTVTGSGNIERVGE
jgi:hypothetical protein